MGYTVIAQMINWIVALLFFYEAAAKQTCLQLSNHSAL